MAAIYVRSLVRHTGTGGSAVRPRAGRREWWDEEPAADGVTIVQRPRARVLSIVGERKKGPGRPAVDFLLAHACTGPAGRRLEYTHAYVHTPTGGCWLLACDGVHVR